MKKQNNSISSRMKIYEAVPKNFLTIGCPKIIRLDMRAGHTFCKYFKRPFDDVFSECMIATTKALCEQVPGVVLGYTQSDEISLVINDKTKNNEINLFFNGNVEKIVSITASIATIAFNKKYAEIVGNLKDDAMIELYSPNLWKAQFDSRTFCLPDVSEVHNYILSRQQDATRNSIQMVGHANFSNAEMRNKNSSEIQDMLITKGINWNNYPSKFKRGCIVVKEIYEKDVTLPNGENISGVKRKRWAEKEIPILTKEPDFISSLWEKSSQL